MPNQKSLWETGEGVLLNERWFSRTFSRIRTLSTRRKGEEEEAEQLMDDVTVCVRHGRLVVRRLNKDGKVVAVTYKSQGG